MKHVLVIDESPLFREYLKSKLTENGIEVDLAINGLDGNAKIRSILPDLVILDYHLTRQTCKEVLEEKKRNPNTAPIPVIVTAQRIDQRNIIELVNYNVKKVFTKPIKIDALYKVLSELLEVQFDVDRTPCIIEAHVNDNIIFVEIAKGLNLEKLDLLRFKIAELMELYQIRTPKVLIMLSDVKLSYGDATNVEKLLNLVLSASRAKPRNVRILTKEDFVRTFVKGKKEYEEIEVVSNLQYALDGLLSELDGRMEFGEKKAEIIGDRILRSKGDSKTETVQLKFETEAKRAPSLDEIREAGKNLRIAAVDDDFVIQELLKTSFDSIGATVKTYSDGDEFLAALDSEDFDLVFLDILMPRVNGFEVMQELRIRDIDVPVIVLSAVTQREAVVKAFQQGVKSYLVKPLKSDAIFTKAVEILRPNF